MRTYYMYRSDDVSGLSGEGLVAEVVEWADTTATMRWLPTSSPQGLSRGVEPTVVHHPSLRNILALHDHDGRTFLREAGRDREQRLGDRLTFNDIDN